MTKEQIIQLIIEKLKWKKDKALSWYKTENPHLKGARPEELVKRGQSDKIIEFLNRRERERKDNEND